MGHTFQALANGALALFDQSVVPMAKKLARRAVKQQYRGRPGFLLPRLMPVTVRRCKLLVTNHGTPFGGREMPPEFIGHRVARRVIVVHLANRKGPHVDIHMVDEELGLKTSWVINLPSKELEIRLNNKGQLTQRTKDAVLDLVREEFQGRVYIAQSLDHTLSQARTEWWHHEVDSGYGAGELREVIADDRIDLFKSGRKLQWMDWRLNPHQESYAFQVFAGDNDKRNTPIWAVGYKQFGRPQVEDRLHLKFDKDPEKFLRLVGEDAHITIKEDGASFYFEATPQGTRFYAPRHSKKTGERIDYTARFGDMRNITTSERISGMGELLMYRKGKVLAAHEIGGLLNRNSPLPEDIDVEGVVYRIDRVGRRVHTHDPIEVQAELVQGFAARHASLRPPTRISPSEVHGTQELEGVVGVRNGASLGTGRKLKWRGDTVDWEVEDVTLKPGAKGGIQGVVWFRSLTSGKRFKLGGGPLGPMAQRQDMMENPDSYVGRVAKVACLNGHEGRGAKFEEWHMDKGVGS